MLVGYVSDERYLALADTLFEFMGGEETVAMVRSSPRGAVFADLPPGQYRVAVAKDGFGAKTVTVRVPEQCPYHFRLLSDTLLGYVWPKWVKSGHTSEYRIHAAEESRLSLYRYGLTKEFIRLVVWHGEHGPRASIQVTPDGDYTQTGVQWNKHGYSNPHHGQAVIAPERSGLYYFHLKGRSGAFFSFPWVVAPANPTAKIAVMASTNNWNAYNNFGGRSNYIHATHLPPEPTMNARLELDRYIHATVMDFFRFPNEEYLPLSFDRPEPLNHVPEHVQVTDPIEGRQECHNAPTEWRLLAWLEREGYAYDLYADYQLHAGDLDLDAYKVLILSTHPEYWSIEAYERVKQWVYERGGRLMYLGGNGIEGPVQFLDGGRAFRCLNHWGGVDNSGTEPPGTYDGRFDAHHESAAKLLGVVCDSRGIMTGAPYQVKDGSHWAFEGTGLKNGDLFGIRSLHERCWGGASGHETDKMNRNSPPGTRLLAKGTNPDKGGAEMVAYETASGGAVFSAGSITYPASVIVDEPLSRVTRNVLDRFLR